MSVQSTAQATPRRNTNRLFEKFYPYGSVLPALVVIVLFTIYPVIYALRISVYQYILTKPNVTPFYRFQEFS